jgi:hypothetical protein
MTQMCNGAKTAGRDPWADRLAESVFMAYASGKVKGYPPGFYHRDSFMGRYIQHCFAEYFIFTGYRIRHCNESVAILIVLQCSEMTVQRCVVTHSTAEPISSQHRIFCPIQPPALLIPKSEA